MNTKSGNRVGFVHIDKFVDNLMLTSVGEWWNVPVEAIEDYMKLSGDGPNSSNAYTINGLPGSLYQCSDKGKLMLME